MTEGGFQFSDRRHTAAASGSRNDPNRAFEDALRGIPLRRMTEEQQRRTKEGSFGDPRNIRDNALHEHLSGRRMATSARNLPIRRTGAVGNGGTVQMATNRPHDPIWNWKQNNLPVDFTDPDQLQRVREFCNTPDAPITMADGSTKAIADVMPGDVVWGWTYITTWNGGMKRRYVPSTVIATNTRTAPNVVRLHMASGATVTCTADHKWANPHYMQPQAQPGIFQNDWTKQQTEEAAEYRVAEIGAELLNVANIRAIFNPGIYASASYGDMSVSDSVMDKVVSIEQLGSGEVVSMQTTTGNYIAWGYASKNCRLLYVTHPIVSACIDIYSKLPLQGMHFECLAGDTKVWTDQGLKPIETLAGEVHRILTTGGKWVEGKFEAYGERELYEIQLQRNGRSKTLYATEGHRWFAFQGNDQQRRREALTTELEPGMRLVSSYARPLIGQAAPSPFGIAHGFTYGDGTLATWGGGSVVDLHGEKDAALLPYFALCTQKAYPRPEHTKDAPVKVSHLPAFFKRLPDIDEGVAYLYGWLAGYFAADGTVSKKGECYLDSADRSSIEFADLVCQRLGIKTYEPYEITVARTVTPQGREYLNRTMYRLPIDPASLTEAFFVIAEHRARWTSDRKRVGEWTVVSVRKTESVEQVYCAVVPGTEAFTIEGNILTGNCKDPQLVDFYSELFFDRLDYEEHLLRLGRQYWLSGEIFSLGSWNETLGIWDKDQIINPDDVEVEQPLFLDEPEFTMALPQRLRELLTTRQPRWQYQQIIERFPELLQYVNANARMPVSNIVLKQMRFEGDDFSNRGIPILMRAMRTLIQEEMLNSALDAIADRLYTPLILAKLGASANELGTSVPWVPSQDEMDDFNALLDASMAADFRVLTYHWAVEIQEVFGKQNVPDLSNDFDRIDERILMVFGLSQTMLTGATAGETYAADALNRDVVTQLMTHFQRMQKKFVRDRMLVVAEAQGHFDYEVRNGMRYLNTEEIFVIDEETGEERIEEVPKLLVPDLEFESLNLSDKEQERQFVEVLAEADLPVPYRVRLHSVGIDLETAVEQRKEEAVMLAVAEAETDKETYRALKRGGYPIPDELKEKFDPKAIQPGQQATMPGEPTPLPALGGQMEIPGLAPDPEDQDAENEGEDPETGEDEYGPDDAMADADSHPDGTPKNRPQESDEERDTMPKKAASLSKEAVAHNSSVERFGRQEIREATRTYWAEVEAEQGVKVVPLRKQASSEDTDGDQDDGEEDPEAPPLRPTGQFAPPRHIGMRYRIAVPDEFKLSKAAPEPDHSA